MASTRRLQWRQVNLRNAVPKLNIPFPIATVIKHYSLFICFYFIRRCDIYHYHAAVFNIIIDYPLDNAIQLYSPKTIQSTHSCAATAISINHWSVVWFFRTSNAMFTTLATAWQCCFHLSLFNHNTSLFYETTDLLLPSFPRQAK